MAKPLRKSERLVFILDVKRALGTMWILMFLHSIYLAVTFAQTTSPEVCPRTCECSTDIVKCIQRGFAGLPVNISTSVKVLDLSGNNITEIKNDAFLKYPNLFELNLNYNDINDVSMLGKFPKSLQHLYLKGNKLQSLTGVSIWSSLTKLDVSENQITGIDNVTFQDCKQLNELNLGNNKLKSIADNVLISLPSLKKLKMDGNHLTKIPNINLQYMNTLDLSNNLLENLSFHDFQSMPSLELLMLSNNKIKSIKTAAFWKLKLKKIYLDNNLLTSVRGDWLFGLKYLLHLYLQNNKIINIISRSWDANTCCGKLKFINLANNKLERVLTDKASGHGGRFADLRSLVSLNLSSNGLFGISDNSFKSLQRLKVLDLSDNKLSWTSYDSNGTFRGLRSLKKLDLSQNEITTVVKVMFDEIPTVIKLDITNNPIEEVSSKSFSPLKNLKDLRMNTHSLYCGCKLQWFFQWLKTKLEAKHFSRLSMLKCRQPRRLYQRDFSSIQSKDLVCDFSRPEIMEHPRATIALDGQNVRLSCAVRNGSIDGIRIVWKKDLKPIDNSHSEVKEITQVTDGNSLYYQSVLHLFNVNEPRDAGLYQCIVITHDGELKSRKARLDVFVAPRFTSKPRDLGATLGGDARFNCSASGYPAPKIYFTRSANIHKLVAQGRIGLHKETFIIRNVTLSDVGLYRCFAESKAGLINTTFQINMRGKPVAVQPMMDKVVLRHDSVMFACVTTGWPAPTFVWLKNGKDIDLTSKNIKHHRERNAEYLMIVSAGDSDAGEYKCLVSNKLGATELTSRLTVVDDISAKNTTTTSSGGLTTNKFIAAMIFTASLTMVLTALVSVACLHVLHRRGCSLCPSRKKFPDAVAMDMYDPDLDQQEFIEMEQNSSEESPRSSSTFVTSNSQSDSNFLQTSGSDSGSTKEHRGDSFDGRQSSGVCSMNSSSSSLASATTSANHRNTFPFSNTAKGYYPAISFYETSDDSASSGTGTHCSGVCCGAAHPLVQRQSLLARCIDHHPSGRRKHSSRSSDRRVDKRHKGTLSQRLCDRSSDDVAVTSSPESVTTAI